MELAMPMINVFTPQGALTRPQVELLTEKLTRELLVIEGVDNDASRSIAWVLFHEVNAHQWAVGGRFDDHYVPDGGRFLVFVSVPNGGLFARGKKDDVARAVDRAIREVLELPAEEGKRWAPWVIVNDVPNGNWGAGGLIRTLWDIGGYARKNVVALPDSHPTVKAKLSETSKG
jgi:phenylpyruvate tautomerase PptA (4-oxalocrotonate tautomerase family)